MVSIEDVASQRIRPFASKSFPSADALERLQRVRLPLPVTLYVICVVIPIGFQVGSLAMTTLRILLLALTVPLMVQVLTGRYGKVLATDILFTGHILWAGIALAVNNPGQVVEQVGSVGIEFLGGYAVGRAYIRTPQTFLALCRFLVLVVLASLPFALVETQTGHPPALNIIRDLPGVGTVAEVYADRRLGLERVQFTFAHPIHYGLFCSVVMSLAFVALKGSIGNFRRYFFTVFVGLSGFLALSSGALLAIFLQIGFFVWAAMFVSIRQRWWILFGLFFLAYIVIDILSNRSAIMVFLSYATFSSHTAYWRSIIFDWGMANVLGSAEKGVVGHPIFGIGLNNWIRPSYMYSGSMDNFWLVMAVRYGVPGFLLLATGYIVVLARVMRREFESDLVLAQIRRAWVFTFIGLTLTLCTVHVWSNIYSFVMFMFGSGVWLILAEPAVARNAVDHPNDGLQRQVPRQGYAVRPHSKQGGVEGLGLPYTRFHRDRS